MDVTDILANAHLRERIEEQNFSFHLFERVVPDATNEVGCFDWKIKLHVKLHEKHVD